MSDKYSEVVLPKNPKKDTVQDSVLIVIIIKTVFITLPV